MLLARAATRQHERAVALEGRIDLAREVHEGVVQRLFGVSLALSHEELLDADSQARCAAEVQTALADLRARSGGLPIRLVTKSIRSVAILRRLLATGP